MIPDTRVNDLLLRWEELRDQGQAVPAEELCADHPELIDEVKRHIQALQALDPVLRTRLITSPVFKTADSSGEMTLDQGTRDRTLRPLPTLPDYDLLAELGRGGMGVVYKARQVSLNRVVALKMILAGAHAGPRELMRFHTEAQAVAALQHPNIVQIYQIGDDNGCPYFSLEFVDGGSLEQKIDASPLPPREAAGIAEKLARAIHYAHTRGIIHRDLKPANVLLARSDPIHGVRPNAGPVETGHYEQRPAEAGHYEPKITDFGLAKRLQGGGALTRSGAVMGTPCYMAPEQATGKTQSIGPATDVYGLGAILYEMLTGAPPFEGDNEIDTLRLVITAEPTPPDHIRGDVPRDLAAVCLKCLEKDPARRYATAEALADDLRRYLDGQPVQARPMGWCRRTLRRLRRRPAVALAVVGAAAAALALFAWLSLGDGPVYTDEQIRVRAASLRTTLAEKLWQHRAADGWILRRLSARATREEDAEVWAHEQALTAVLSTPEATNSQLKGVLTSLDIPFGPGMTQEWDDGRFGRRKFGWLAHPESDYTSAPAALWTALALVSALDRPGLLNAAERKQLLDRLAYTESVLANYRPAGAAFTGGWDMFPLQKDPTETSTYATALALLALLETRQAGLPWEGSLQARDELLAATAHWLGEHFDDHAGVPGWRETGDPADRILDGLTLQIYALLLRAESEAGYQVPAPILRAIPAHLQRCAGRRLDFPDASHTHGAPYRFTSHTGQVIARKDPTAFVWYPWAVRCSWNWLDRCRRLNAPPRTRLAARRVLGHLVVDLGEDEVKKSLSGYTYVAAETLYGLAAVPPPGPAADSDGPGQSRQ